MPKKKLNVKSLYCITHIENIPSILSQGILCHTLIKERGIQYTPTYDEQIVANRRSKAAPDGRSLWEFANLYFQPRNPMLYRVLHEKRETDVVVLGTQPQVLSFPGIFIASGNAASSATEILPPDKGMN